MISDVLWHASNEIQQYMHDQPEVYDIYKEDLENVIDVINKMFKKLYVPIDKNVTEFMIACYNDNSIEELKQALLNEPDKRSMEDWHLSPSEYYQAINQALIDKIKDI